MYPRLLFTFLTILLFNVIAMAQDELKVSFEPEKYPVTRTDLYTIKVTNSTSQAVTAKIMLEVQDPNKQTLYSWVVPAYAVQPGTQQVQMKGMPGMTFTPDNINSAQYQDQLAVRATVTMSGAYGYSEKTTIYRFPAPSFDFSSQFSTNSTPAATSDTTPRTTTPPTTATDIIDQAPAEAGSPSSTYISSTPPPPRTTTPPSTTIVSPVPAGSLTGLNAMPEKMNVFYIGVDNPLVIAGADEFTTATCDQAGISIRPSGLTDQFNVTVNKPGAYTLTINSGGQVSEQVFRAKRIPNPVAQLGNKKSGSIGVGEFKAQRGVITILENFDFDARCQTSGFVLWRVQLDGTRESVVNQGPRFSGESTTLINQAVPGDIYIFDNIKARCPGDAAGRQLGAMTFFIK